MMTWTRSEIAIVLVSCRGCRDKQKLDNQTQACTLAARLAGACKNGAITGCMRIAHICSAAIVCLKLQTPSWRACRDCVAHASRTAMALASFALRQAVCARWSPQHAVRQSQAAGEQAAAAEPKVYAGLSRRVKGQVSRPHHGAPAQHKLCKSQQRWVAGLSRSMNRTTHW